MNAQQLTGCVAVLLAALAASPAWSAPSNEACQARANDTSAKLLECIQQQELWRHLAALQDIASQNPDPKGHGNRDTGTTGYRDSVNYVARLARQAGYAMTIQAYDWTRFNLIGTPLLESAAGRYTAERDWFVARLSGSGTVTAPVQPARNAAATAAGDAASGCSAADFAGFGAGHIALVRRGDCDIDTQAANATAAGAAALIVYNTSGAGPDNGKYAKGGGGAFASSLSQTAKIPVAATASYAMGNALYRQYASGPAPAVHIDIKAETRTDKDYNLIADSPYGDPNHVVVVEGHLDSIFGAGILDNGSGSSTILEIALKLANTHTRNQLRYIWFGGEELGLLGSHYYTKHLTQEELGRIVFDVDADVTATPNFAVLIADPQYAPNAKKFPPNVVPESRIGNKYFADFFQSAGIPSRPASFGNDGTDSNSFSLHGVPDTGILTQQDCCKKADQVKLWGGYLGNYEGKIPSFNGGCVDYPRRWCDNLPNNDPLVLEFASKAVAYVTFKLANNPDLGQQKR